MDDLQEFINQADQHRLRFALNLDTLEEDPTTDTLLDAIQLPITALALLYLAGEYAGQLRVASMGMNVGATLVHTYPQFKRVGRKLEWSLRVRRVCAEALAFLEAAKLFQVQESTRDGRQIRLSPAGRSFMRTSKSNGGDIADLSQRLEMSAARTRTEGVFLI